MLGQAAPTGRWVQSGLTLTVCHSSPKGDWGVGELGRAVASLSFQMIQVDDGWVKSTGICERLKVR